MPVHIVGGTNPDCPLCKKPFERASAYGVEYLFCRKDKIQILPNDPMIKHWSNVDPETGEGVPCTNEKCHGEMRVFTRSDGYMKSVCPNPKCGAAIETEQLPDANLITELGKGNEATDGLTKKGVEAKDKWLNN
ncbi:MAG: hypothetical protein GY928_27800 [Colwellia sp.]|nr:hypothetical protein [Colwellia sp.]